MNGYTRHVNAIKIKTIKLADELFEFVSLIIMTSIESLFLFVFSAVHSRIHVTLDRFSWCPLKIAILIMGLCFMLLNLVIVGAFVLRRSVAILNSLKSILKKSGSGHSPGDRTSPRKVNLRTPTAAVASKGTNITTSTTIARASRGSSRIIASAPMKDRNPQPSPAV